MGHDELILVANSFQIHQTFDEGTAQFYSNYRALLLSPDTSLPSTSSWLPDLEEHPKIGQTHYHLLSKVVFSTLRSQDL